MDRTRPLVGRTLGILFVFSGLGVLWLWWRVVRSYFVTRAVSRYFTRIRAIEPLSQIDNRHFPLGYYRDKLLGADENNLPSMIISPAGVQRSIVDHGWARYVDVYTFRFGPSTNHLLIVMFDQNGKVVQVLGENLSMAV